MTSESDENQNTEPEATPELVSEAIEKARIQGMDINPYSVALVAGIAPQVLFVNSELMNLVIAARGDQTTFSIDTHLLERCQELEHEMAKLLEINQEIYDRALEMEERVIQLENKITEMDEDNEHLTLQLQNSWHLGYKKGLNDGQAESGKPREKPLIDIELPKEEAVVPSAEVAAAEQQVQAQTEKEETKPEEQQPASQKEGFTARPIIDIELPKEEKGGPSLLDIELPLANNVPGHESLLSIELPEAQKLNANSLLDIELPEAEKLAASAQIPAQSPGEQPSIKSLLDIELPKEEKQSIKSLLDIELPKEEKQSIKMLLDIELPKEEKQSIKSLLDIELPKPENTEAAPREAAGAAPTFNDRVFNAVSDSVTSGSAVESYGSLSWREVETIYQFSAAGGSSGASPNLVFEPLAPGQAVGARAGEGGEATGKGAQGGDTTAYGAPGAAAYARGETQPMRTDTQPIITKPPAGGAGSGGGESLPPILKADAPTPRTVSGKTPAQGEPVPGGPGSQNPRQTFTRLDRPIPEDLEPPLERTMSQFLGDTNSYINLDRVTMAPATDELLPAPEGGASPDGAAQPPQSADSAPSNQASAQAETQTLAGATQALKAEAKARAQASAEAVSGQTSGAPPAGEHAPPFRSIGPGEAKFTKREADVTFDGLTAMENDTASDVLDLEKLDIFEGMEDMEELNQIEVIEDVVIPGMPPPESSKRTGMRSSERIPVVNSDDLQDLIKSRIKKAEAGHEPPRFDTKSPMGGSGAGSSGSTGTASGTSTNAAGGDNSGASTSSSSKNEAVTPPPIPSVKELDALRQGARNKFVGGKASSSPLSMPGSTNQESPIGASQANASMLLSTRGVPPEIRKACMILGVRPETLTVKEVNEKWKAQLSAPGVHPDQGGDTESAIYLNTAKDTLVKWINDQDSKLGKKFGKKEEPKKDDKKDEK